MGKLKPCPFCGGEAILQNVDAIGGTGGYYTLDALYSVTCRPCDIGTGKYYNKTDPTKAWNRRVDDEKQ